MAGSDRNLHPSSKVNDPPPPYRSQADQVTPNMGEKGAPPGIPDGRWDLACSIDVQGGLLQLNAAGEPTWTPDDDIAMFGDGAYRRDGFGIWGVPSLAQVMVANRAYTWTCDANTVGGQLLMSKRDNVSLKSLGKHLVVFEQTVAIKDRDRPSPKPRDDPKGCLEVKLQSTDIWHITGTDIYRVEGDGNDLVVQSPEYLRLWDMAKGKVRWEKKKEIGGRICGFTKEYVIKEVGSWQGSRQLRERKTGNLYGDFDFPWSTAFIDFDEKNHFGPVLSISGLFLYKPCPKALFIFRIGKREVEFRIWESTEDIRGSLVLRGSLENLELELIGQKPTWTKHKKIVSIDKKDYFKSKFL